MRVSIATCFTKASPNRRGRAGSFRSLAGLGFITWACRDFLLTKKECDYMSELPDPAKKLQEFRESIRLKTRYLLELGKNTDAQGNVAEGGVAAARKACGLDEPEEGEDNK